MKLRTSICLLTLVTITVLALANSLNSSNAQEDKSTVEIQSVVSSTSSQQRFDVEAEEKTGPAPYIIGLRVGFQPEGMLSSNEAEAQREAIGQAQDTLLNKMEGQSVTNVKRFKFIPFIAMTVDATGLEKLQSLPDVASIEEDIQLQIALAESVPLVNAPAMWSGGLTGSGQVVAVLDTGVDKNHPFLAGKVVSEACYSTTGATTASVCPGGVSQSTAPNSGLHCTFSAECNHGTHVAGIAAGNGATFSGVAKDANIIAIQVFSRVTSNNTTTAFFTDVVRGLERAYELRSSFNIASVNMSLGGGQHFSYCDAAQPSAKAAIDNLRSANIASVIASGNNGFTDSMGAPACISSAISVGNTGDGSTFNGITATQDIVVSSSNTTPFLSLFAPGRWINSSIPGGGFDNFNGTSMAAPHVAGAWAILKQQNPSATVDQIFSNIAGSGTPIMDSRGSINIWKSRLNLSNLGCTYTRTPSSQNFSSAGGNGTINITTAGNCSWWSRANAFSTYTKVVSNTAPINVADSTGGTPGLGSVYPSIINVSGMTGTIFKVRVTLHGLSHTNPDDLDILLVHPNGTTRSIVMSDAGGAGDVNNLTLIFDEQSPVGFIPDEGPLTSSSYWTTNRTGSEGINDNFPAPGPGSASYGAFLNFFNGLTSNNGDWKLYVVDDTTGETGSISGGWTLEIQTKSATGWLSITPPDNGTGNGTVNYTVSANTFTGTRTGTITAAGQIFTVTQDPSGGGGGATIQFSSATYNVNENGGSATITVTRSDGNGTASVNYATSNGTATAGSDYTASSGTLNFANTETSKTFSVPITNDTVFEGNETVNLALSNPMGATLGSPNTAVLTINDNDTQPSISINDVSLNEGNSGTTNFTFNVNLSNASTQTVTVNYATANGTATAPSDYVSIPTTLLTFNPNETSKQVTVQVNGDTTVEANENFFVNLSGAVNATISDNQGVGTIQNDDSANPGTLQFSSATYNVAENGGSITITVTRAGGSDGSVSVNYATSNGTATSGSDYTTASGTLTFVQGDTSETFNVTILDDALVEGNETVNLALSNATGGATLGNPNTAVLTINDNDSQPTISINDVSQNEGNSGTTNFTFNVTLSNPSAQTVTVNYATANGTAVAPSDYTAIASTQLTFNPNETSKTVNVSVNGDTDVESNETFFVSLSNPTNATISDNQGVGTIQNDDAGGCPVTLNPTSQTFSSSGGTSSSVNVTVPAGCAWTASVTSSFADLPFVVDSPFSTFAKSDSSSKAVDVSDLNNPRTEADFTFNADAASLGAIPDGAAGCGNFATSTPKDVTFNVSGITGTITGVKVSMTFSPAHSWGGDIWAELRAPNDVATKTIFKNRGSTTPTGCGSANDLAGPYNFFDTATGTNADLFNSVFGTPTPSGDYKANTPCGSAGCGTPTPITPAFAGLTNAQANGTWKLRLIDGGGGDTGSISAASITITTDGGGTTSWITNIQPGGGTGPGSFTYNVASYTGTTQRQGTITVTTSTGSATHTVIQNPPSPGVRKPFDYDGDNKADRAIFRPSNGNWFILQSSNGGLSGGPFGTNGDIPIEGNFDNDTKADMVIFRPSTGQWIILQSSNQTALFLQLGGAGDIPTQGDYDGDGRTDPSVWRQSNSGWYYLKSTTNYTTFDIIGFGLPNDIPVQGDFDGDGRTDRAIFRPSNGNWFILQSSNGGLSGGPFGTNGDIPIEGNFDNDTKADMAIFRPSTGQWIILRSSDQTAQFLQLGASTDTPTPADYDGDGRTDPSVWRQSNSGWYYLKSTTNYTTFDIIGFGLPNDIPLERAGMP